MPHPMPLLRRFSCSSVILADVRRKADGIESRLIKTEQIPLSPDMKPLLLPRQSSHAIPALANKPTVRYVSPMTEAHRREKQPEHVRRSLLDHAARCAVDEGLGSLTLQAVADAASVTKGGLLHHFPSKQALIAAVFEDLLGKLDEEIDRLMREDPIEQGRFTRAYIDAFFQVTRDGAKSPWAALSISCMTDARLRELWSDWMREKLTHHAATDSHPAFKLARYAADGIWLANLTEPDGIPAEELAALRNRLKHMTQEEGRR